MTRSDPSPATKWLIEVLASRGIHASASKIERIQKQGLAPRPLFHRSETFKRDQLWPQRAVEHYTAVIPLVRQRHDATELAAVTMIGWGFPIETSLLHRSYAKVYALPEDKEGLSEAMLRRYQNRGMPLVKTALSHMRSHGFASKGQDAEELADQLLGGALSLSTGTADDEQIRGMLSVILPRYTEAPNEVIELIIKLFAYLQREISMPKLLETAVQATADELLSVLPQASVEFAVDIKRFGGFDSACSACAETKGLLIGAALPFHFRLRRLDFASLLPGSFISELRTQC